MEVELKKRIFSSIILIPVVFFIVLKGSFYFFLLLLICFFISCYEWHKMSKNKYYHILGFLFLCVSFYSILQLRIAEENSYNFFLIILLICIFSDLGGYFFGKIFKGPRLTTYSPNKTYAGLIGGYVLSLTLIPLMIYFKLIAHSQILIIVIFFLLVSTVSQIGDIIVSIFKRKSKIKDTGNLIPGHGGILDRIDGMLFAFPFAYFVLFNNLFFNI